jgi:hypothetical protein
LVRRIGITERVKRKSPLENGFTQQQNNTIQYNSLISSY